MADGAANRAELAEAVDLPPHSTPSYDTPLLRLVDPVQLEAALHRFAAAWREGLGLGGWRRYGGRQVSVSWLQARPCPHAAADGRRLGRARDRL
jgi:hypothetical protein